MSTSLSSASLAPPRTYKHAEDVVRDAEIPPMKKIPKLPGIQQKTLLLLSQYDFRVPVY